MPRANRLSRVRCSKSVALTPSALQKSMQCSRFAVLSTSHIAPTCQPTDSATSRNTQDAAASIVDEFANASITAYCARRWRSARFCSVRSRNMPYAPIAVCPAASGTTVTSTSSRVPSLRRRWVIERAVRPSKPLRLSSVASVIRSAGTMKAAIGRPTSSASSYPKSVSNAGFTICTWSSASTTRIASGFARMSPPSAASCSRTVPAMARSVSWAIGAARVSEIDAPAATMSSTRTGT